jgi:hypothetical protein
MWKSDYPKIRKIWGAVFDQYHLDMAMSGHVHTYVRSKPMYNEQVVRSPEEGTIYITSVAIPSGYDEHPDDEYSDVHFGGGMLYQTLDIVHKRLIYRARQIDGTIRDELIIQK